MEKKRVISDATTDILHHIGLINSSLDDSAARYEKLGFLLTPLSIPRIPLKPGAAPEILGAGNRHAIFKNNYLELLGVVDPERWAQITREQRGPFDLDAPLSRYEGLHVMHFGTDHIEQVAERLDRQGTPHSPIKEYQRNVQTESGAQTMKARTIHFPAGSNPEGLLQIAQHDTPELIFQDRYMHHPNGAIALTGIVVIAADPLTYVTKYEQYTGHESRLIDEHHFEMDLGHSRITVVDPGHLDRMIPGYKVPALPFLAAFTIETVSLALVRHVLSLAGIPYQDQQEAVLVAAEHACGCAIIFSAQQ